MSDVEQVPMEQVREEHAKRVSKGEAERREKDSKYERDVYRARVSEDLAMHHKTIGELIRVVGLLELRVRALEEPKIIV